MHRFVSYDGTTLAHHVKGDGPPLVCVPGGPGLASAYLGDLGGLSAYRRLIALDNRGSGASDVPHDPTSYRCDRLPADVEALRVHLGMDRIDLLGHSAGAQIATLYAAGYPDRVRRLVLVGPGWNPTGLELDDDEFFASVHRRSGEPWYAEAYAALVRWNDGEDTPENRLAAAPFFFGAWSEAAQEMARSDAERRSRPATEGFRAGDAPFGDPARTRAALRALAAPALLVGGELDPAPTPRLLRDFAALFSDGRAVVVPGAGHSPWIDDPTRFVGTVLEFLDVNEPAGRTRAPR
jgi:pimeloyl-ACP methyl ester carboxylesterase